MAEPLPKRKQKVVFRPDMSPEDFENENQAMYLEKYVEDNSARAYLVNSWQLDSYYDSIDWPQVKRDMADAYFDWLEENY